MKILVFIGLSIIFTFNNSLAQGGNNGTDGGPGITLFTSDNIEQGNDLISNYEWLLKESSRDGKPRVKSDEFFIPQDTVDIGLLDGTVMDKESLIDAYGSELIQFTGRGMRVNKHVPIKDYQTRDGVIHETKWFQKSTSDDADDYSYPYND